MGTSPLVGSSLRLLPSCVNRYDIISFFFLGTEGFIQSRMLPLVVSTPMPGLEAICNMLYIL